jgi:hypothetical protein
MSTGPKNVVFFSVQQKIHSNKKKCVEKQSDFTKQTNITE